jgi:hypothetical protein
LRAIMWPPLPQECLCSAVTTLLRGILAGTNFAESAGYATLVVGATTRAKTGLKIARF